MKEEKDKRPACDIEDMESVKDVISAFLDSDDPLGSYTGTPDSNHEPTQDADDL